MLSLAEAAAAAVADPAPAPPDDRAAFLRFFDPDDAGQEAPVRANFLVNWGWSFEVHVWSPHQWDRLAVKPTDAQLSSDGQSWIALRVG